MIVDFVRKGGAGRHFTVEVQTRTSLTTGPFMFRSLSRAFAAVSFLALLPPAALVGACGSGSSVAPQATPGAPDAGSSPADGSTPDTNTPTDAGHEDTSLRFEDRFARSAHARPLGGWVVLLERPVHMHERLGRPDRQIAILDANGKEEKRVAPAPGRELLDVAVHTSGQLTALEASDDGYHLVRLDGSGVRLRETPLVDEAIYTDAPKMNAGESRSRIETFTHDAGRIVASSEGIVLATRTGRHSVVVYGVAFDPSAGYSPAWRSLVVPAHAITPVGLNGGSYDTFGQLEAPYAVHVARDAAGIIYVAVQHARLESGAMVKALESVFGEELTTDPDYLDLFVTRVRHNGTRLGVSVVGTPEDDQLYGLRADASGVMAVGRSEIWNAQGTGFEALVGHVDAEGNVAIDRFGVDRGDLAFDAVHTSSGLVVVGTRGYAQNPHGASISEEAHPFALALTAGAIELPDGPRNGQARFVVPAGNGRLLVGGMLDGPGTHSADVDGAQLRARGFITFVATP